MGSCQGGAAVAQETEQVVRGGRICTCASCLQIQCCLCAALNLLLLGMPFTSSLPPVLSAWVFLQMRGQIAFFPLEIPPTFHIKERSL